MTAFETEAFEALRARLRGTLLLPGTPAYDDGRSLWNAMIDRKPAAIARCLGVADIVECVRFAKERDLSLAIKGGGHNIAGLALCDGGLVIDLALMRGVWVDPAGRVVRAQGGCLLGDVDRETQLHGLAAAMGFVSSTGIAGLTLGGGFGYLTRRFGWTSDTVRAMELVDANGDIVHGSEKENPDLFWGLRGGGGNFGVVTGFEYELEPLGPQIVGGVIAWRAADAPGVLELYREIVEDAPPELTCVCVLRKAPPAPWLSKEVHGQQIVALVVCDTGPVAEGEARVKPIKSHGAPVGDVVQRRPYVTQQSILDATQPKGRRYYWKSEYLPGFDAELLEKAAVHAERMVSPHSAVILFPIDGAIERLPKDHSAVGNRDARGVLNIAASWESSTDDDANIAWAREGWRQMRAFSTGGAYVNFQTEDEGADRVLAAYGENYDRLVEVKSRWDPENFFRTNKNIAPLAS